MKTLKLLLFVTALAQTAIFAAPLEWFVAPNGNDEWSGRAATPKSGGIDGPFATIPAALKAARLFRNEKGSADAITIWIRGGLYQLDEPIALTPADSGFDAKHPLTISAYKKEKPVISGGRRITGWKPVPNKPGQWETEIPAVREGKWYFHQLFVNGQRAQRARTPNEGFFRIDGPSPTNHPVQFKFKDGEIKKAWAAEGDVEVIAYLAWADIRMQIRNVDEEKHIVTLSGNPRPSNKEDKAQYYIENAPDALDQPGEWYLDRKTGKLTYWALPRESMAKVEAIASQLPELLILKGDFDGQKPVQNIVLRGLTFSHTDWKLGPNGHADTQAVIASHGDVRGEAAVDCLIEDCTFSHLGNYALDFARGCKRIKIVGNEIADIGAGGVRLGEGAIRNTDFEQSSGHIVTDNHMHHMGEVFPPAVGVLILQSGQNRVAHNHIHDLYYTAISVGWTWGYRESPCKENIIEFNDMHDLGKFRLSDMGAVYTLGPQPGTVVRNNIIHDVNSFTYGGWGLYTDEGSTGIVMENNIVYRTKSAGFHQHYGKENIIRNNIFAFGKESQLMRTRDEGHTSFYLSNNIVYFDSGKLLGSNWGEKAPAGAEGKQSNKAKPDDTSATFPHYVIDYNDYYDTRIGTTSAPMEFSGAPYEKWKARGHDEHSIFADPLFVNAKKYDFRLRRNSPALKIGFKPIDASKIGIRPKGKRD